MVAGKCSGWDKKLRLRQKWLGKPLFMFGNPFLVNSATATTKGLAIIYVESFFSRINAPPKLTDRRIYSASRLSSRWSRYTYRQFFYIFLPSFPCSLSSSYRLYLHMYLYIILLHSFSGRAWFSLIPNHSCGNGRYSASYSLHRGMYRSNE